MSQAVPNKSLRPRMVTVFIAAFLAGGTAAVGVNRFIDVTRTRAKATVECEPIFVALRDLPAGNPVTVWDVKLRDWPKAMVPQAALRPGSFEGIAWPEGHVARLSLREGQPVLRSHLQATLVDAQPAATPSVAVARPKPVAETPVAVTPVAENITVAETATSPDLPAVAEPTAVAEVTPASEPTTVAQGAIAVEAETVPETPAVTAEPAVADVAATGEGWPSAAETAAGSEAAMRFLVVPERIAIMADELTAPRKPEPPKTPVASVATQPKPPKQTAQPKQIPQAKQPTGSTASTGSTGSSKANDKQPVNSRSIPRSSIPRAKYPDEAPTKTQAGNAVQPEPRSMRQQPRSTPASSPKDKPAQRTTSAPTPRVAVEPDPESALADEAARTSTLKSVFPNMAAGLEKIESEMTRIRRERFGSLFRGSGSGEDENASNAEGDGPSGQWLPSLRYR